MSARTKLESSFNQAKIWYPHAGTFGADQEQTRLCQSISPGGESQYQNEVSVRIGKAQYQCIHIRPGTRAGGAVISCNHSQCWLALGVAWAVQATAAAGKC